MTSPAVKSCLCLLSAPPVEPGRSTKIHPDTAFRTADSGRRRGCEVEEARPRFRLLRGQTGGRRRRRKGVGGLAAHTLLFN